MTAHKEARLLHMQDSHYILLPSEFKQKNKPEEYFELPSSSSSPPAFSAIPLDSPFWVRFLHT